MYNGIKNIWKLSDMVDINKMISVLNKTVAPDRIHLKMGNLLTSYLGVEFIMRPYNKRIATGIADPETRKEFWIEVGNWYRNNWYRNKNGKHIAFYFWNHGGLRSFEREVGKLVKTIIRPEDKRGMRQNTFLIFERYGRLLEEGVLFDQGVELGSKPLYLVPYIQKDRKLEEGGKIPLYLKEDPREDLWESANEILENNGLRKIYIEHDPRNECVVSKEENDLLKYEDGIIQGESPRHKGLYRYMVTIQPRPAGYFQIV